MNVQAKRLSLAICAALQAGAAMAQTDESATSRPQDPKRLDELVVTAQRREQNVLDVPLAISAISKETLESTGIDSITDLRFNTPGLITSTGSGYVQTFIRGIGNRIQIGIDPSATTFIDDVPRIYASLVDDLTNVERVEVLKGAQGGLYGRNATAGVINIITRQPNPEGFEAEARLGYGSKDTFDFGAYANFPLTQNAALNLTVGRRTHDDYIDNQARENPYATYAGLSASEAAGFGDTGQREYLLAHPELVALLDSRSAVSHLSDQDETFLDAKLLLQGDGFTVRLAADSTDKDDANGNAWKSLQLSRVYGTYTALMNSSGYGPARLPFDYLYPGAQNDAYGEFQAAGPIESYTKLKDYGGSIKADIDFADFTLTSISAMRWNKSDFRNDVTGSAVPAAGFLASFHRDFFFQELRAVSSGEGPFRWLGGATYLSEDIDNSTATILLGNTLAPSTAKSGGDGWSAYVQGEFDFARKFTLTGSLRYIDETKSAEFPASAVAIFDPVTNTVTNGVPVPAVSAEDKVSKLLPALTLSYALDRGGTAYLRWASGMKTGGANPLVHPAQTLNVLNAAGEEEVDTYEAGFRTTFLDRRLQFTSAVFYNDYTDLQVLKSGYTGLAAFYLNAGRARSRGAEVSLDWQVNDIFRLSTGVGYLDAKFTDFSYPGVPELRIAPFDFSGNRMIVAPEWQGSLAGDLYVPLSDRWDFTGTVLYAYSGSFYTDDSNATITKQEPYSLVNLRVGVRTSDERFGIYLSVDNVFDEEYFAWGSIAPSAISAQLGAPRIVMGSVEVKFR